MKKNIAPYRKKTVRIEKKTVHMDFSQCIWKKNGADELFHDADGKKTVQMAFSAPDGKYTPRCVHCTLWRE